MNLKHIKTTKCPKCNCDLVVSESIECWSALNDDKIRHPPRYNQHCNGQLWERRAFGCGFSVKWIPNFEKEEFVSQCKMSSEYVNMLQKRKMLLAKINSILVEADVDDEYRQRIKNYLP